MDVAAAELTLAAPVEPPRRLTLRTVLVWALGLALLAWSLHGIDTGAFAGRLRGLDWRWLALAIALDIASYACQGWRWRILLRPLGRLSVFETTEAIYAGLFASETLPMRAGEAVRTFVVARKLAARLGAVVPSILVERLMDAFWLAAAAAVAALFVPLPRYLLAGCAVLGAVLAGALAALGLLAVSGRVRSAISRVPLAGPVLEPVASGLRAIGSLRLVVLALAVSLLVLAGQALSLYALMLASGLAYSVWAGCVVLVIVHLGTAIPNAPANIGSYQFFVIVGLQLFGAGKTEAAAFAMTAFVLLTAPLLLLGFVATARVGLRQAKAPAPPFMATPAQQ